MTWALAKALLGGLWKAFRAVKWYVWLALAVAIAFYIYGERKEAGGIAKGRAEVKADWDASVERGRKELERIKAKRAEITVQTEKVYVDRIRVVHEKGQTLIQRIPALVPDDACLLPAGFRLSHDAAASGVIPDTAGTSNAGPAELETIAWRPWNSRPGAAGGYDGGR